MCYLPSYPRTRTAPSQTNSEVTCAAETGYLGTTGLVLAAERETSRKERERAGVISSFALMVGLATGCTTGLVISKLLATPAADR